MRRSQNPYACSTCKKEFHNAISLVRHVELRHPPLNQSSTFYNKNNLTNESHSNFENKFYSSNSKNHTASNDNQPYIIKIEENETNYEDPHYPSNLLKKNTLKILLLKTIP